MAQKVTVTLVDDLEGGAADETVSFGIDGAQYDIDLAAGRATELRDMLGKYAEAGRRIGSGRKLGHVPAGLRSQPKRDPETRELRTKVRDWARENGYDVGTQGRISKEVKDAYSQRHQIQAAVAAANAAAPVPEFADA